MSNPKLNNQPESSSSLPSLVSVGADRAAPTSQQPMKLDNLTENCPACGGYGRVEVGGGAAPTSPPLDRQEKTKMSDCNGSSGPADSQGPSPRRELMLRSEGDIKQGPVSVYFGQRKFGEMFLQATWTEPTLIFTADVSQTEQRFSMNVEFLRDIVRIADELAGSK